MIFKKFFNKDAEKTEQFANKFSLTPKITELILSRGVSTEEEFQEFLHPSVAHDPLLLDGMRELVDRVKLAREMKDNVLIFGDYDVDGVSATAIMLKVLKEYGVKANYYLPNRYVDGYGLTTAVIDKVADLFAPNLIITVDCGVSCYEEVEYAKSKGIEVYVTDHHEIPEILPDTVVVNAKKEGQKYPFRELCGTGVAYKFAEALLGKVKAEKYLPITAIATIVDIVPLKDENRTIVARGLKMCDKYLPVGLKAMFKEYELSLTNPNATDISFKIGPKLNASGRMGDAGDSLKLYFETDPVKIKKDIEVIKGHNLKRQEICNKIYDDCQKALEKQDLKNQRVIVLASKAWDKGVLGIVCSRLVEKYHKPTFLFSQEGDLLCGSGRSIDDINIHELLSSLKDILETFGGHTMAAGLTLKRKNYELFVQKINAFALSQVNDEAYIPIKYYDQDIKEEDLTPQFFKEMTLLEPFGCENPRPKFRISAEQVSFSPMKKYPQHATFKIGKLSLTYFNFIEQLVNITFARNKAFIFEFQGKGAKGTVSDFDGGSFIEADAYKKLNAIEIGQLTFKSGLEAKYTLYPNSELLTFVGGMEGTVFGTCFVTYSCFDYVEFAKNYNTSRIFHFGIYEDKEIGYNSLLLSPKGLDWAKNYSKIVFLSPILDQSFISALNKVTNAEIYVPLEKQGQVRKLSGLDLSRNTFARVFKGISSKANRPIYNVFELYDKCGFEESISFFTFYSALLVFNQLKFLSIAGDEQIIIKINKQEKKELTDSAIYKQLLLIKETFKGENSNTNR